MLVRLGNVDIALLCDGNWRLDGGAFFGIVPKVMWERQLVPDARNRVLLHLNCPLLRVGGKNFLVDTGLGTKQPAKRQEIFDMKVGHLTEDLRAHGLQPEDIDYVLFTHLHWDHAGGATCYSASGELKTTFPKAQYLAQRADWDEATHPTERNKAGYYEEDLVPLMASRQLELLDGDTEIVPGVSCKLTGGHTSGHQIALVDAAGQKAVFFGDIVPTVGHLPLPYGQSYDLYPNELLRHKKDLLAIAEREQWLVLFDHETVTPAGYLTRDEGGRLRLRPSDAALFRGE